MEVISRKQAQEQGLKFYFTGKPCKHGHVSERRTANGHCVVCQKEYDREYHLDNQEKIRLRVKKWKQDNPEKARANNAKWYHENLEKARACTAKWAQKNPEKRSAREAKRRAIKKGWIDNWTPTQKLEVEIIYAEAALIGPNFEVDHIVPLAKGGSHTADNLQIITKAHHAPKGASTWQDRKYI